MGSGTFFSKVASVDPLAQALHLPGADKYAQQEAEDANSTGAVGPYAGVTPTLAAANAGYAPGGPGANANYVPFSAKQPGGFFGTMQKAANLSGNITPSLSGVGAAPSTPSTSTVAGGGANPYATAAAGNPNAQAAMNPQRSANTLFQGQTQGGYRGV